MANLKLWGYEAAEAAQLREEINAVMQRLGMGGTGAVVTVVPSIVEFCDGQHTKAPYVELGSTKPKEGEVTISEMIEALRAAGINEDIEVVELAAFHPKVVSD